MKSLTHFLAFVKKTTWKCRVASISRLAFLHLWRIRRKNWSLHFFVNCIILYKTRKCGVAFLLLYSTRCEHWTHRVALLPLLRKRRETVASLSYPCIVQDVKTSRLFLNIVEKKTRKRGITVLPLFHLDNFIPIQTTHLQLPKAKTWLA